MKNKILIAHKELNLRPSDSVLWCSTTKPQSIKSKDLRINSSWGLRILSYSPPCLWKDTKNIFHHFFTKLKTLPCSLFIVTWYYLLTPISGQGRISLDNINTISVDENAWKCSKNSKEKFLFGHSWEWKDIKTPKNCKPICSCTLPPQGDEGTPKKTWLIVFHVVNLLQKNILWLLID